MQPDRQFVVRALWIAVLLGIAAVIFVHTSEWGIGMSIFAGLFVGGLAIASTASKQSASRAAKLAFGAALALALLLSWRSAPELRFLNGLTMCLFLALGTLHFRSPSLAKIPLLDVTGNLVVEWTRWIEGGCRLIGQDTRRTVDREAPAHQTGGAVARGVFVSLPLVLVFGGLLFSADASFERLVRGAFDFDMPSVGVASAVFMVALVLVAGILRRTLVASPLAKANPYIGPPLVLAERYHSPYHEPGLPKLGALEVCIVLGTLSAMFLTFVVLQLPYLFGGSHHIATTANLSVANYARRGFFELVAVVALAIPTLITLFAMVREVNTVTRRIMAGLACVLVALLGVVLASAAQRMGLYIDLYGLSRLRVYVAAAMVWMALVLGWFASTTLRSRPERFAFGAAVGFTLVLLG